MFALHRVILLQFRYIQYVNRWKQHVFQNKSELNLCTSTYTLEWDCLNEYKKQAVYTNGVNGNKVRIILYYLYVQVVQMHSMWCCYLRNIISDLLNLISRLDVLRNKSDNWHQGWTSPLTCESFYLRICHIKSSSLMLKNVSRLK